MYFPTIEDTVGATPLVRLQRLPGINSNTILVKLEGNNPAGSVKDRPALSMISKAEARGEIKPGDTLIEATSGNTGIALAMVAAIKGYKMILIMPANASQERKDSLTAYGAHLVEVSESDGMEGARDLAARMEHEGKGKVLDQFSNPDNYAAHYEHTGPEIWRDTHGTVTHFVSSMGTTGTIMGVSRFLKEKIQLLKLSVFNLRKVRKFPVLGAGQRRIYRKSLTEKESIVLSIFHRSTQSVRCKPWRV